MILSDSQIEAIKDLTGTAFPLQALIETIMENTDGEIPTGTTVHNGVTFPTYTLPCYECGGTARNVAPWSVSIQGVLAVGECDSCADTH